MTWTKIAVVIAALWIGLGIVAVVRGGRAPPLSATRCGMPYTAAR
jgi:hypothetical protein